MSLQVTGFDSSVKRALLLREADWAETGAMCALASDLGCPAAAYATEHLATYCTPATPPTSQEVRQSHMTFEDDFDSVITWMHRVEFAE